MNKLISRILPIVALFCFTVLGTIEAQQKLVFKDEFKKKKLGRRWENINGTWNIQQNTLEGAKNSKWAILLCKDDLPENYILSFSTLVGSVNTTLFEVMLNLNKEKYLGILLNQLDGNFAIEDRSLFPEEKAIEEGRYIETTGHVGMLPKVHNENKHVWLHWKIQKTNNEIYVWVNDESIISFAGISDITRNDKGKFGFAINGEAKIDNVKLFKTLKEASLPPSDFQGRKLIMPFFLFGE